MGTVQVYHYTDASAPSLTGQAGSLISLLDACLVTGYGSKLAAGWTKPFTNSSSQGCYKNNAGASFQGYISGNTLTITSMTSGAVGLNTAIQGPGVTAGTYVQALGTATTAGQIGTYTLNNSMTVGSSGSPVALTAGSTTVNTVASGTGNCLAVNDNGPGGGSYREARWTGFETLSSVSAGTGQFPTSAQLAIGSGAVVCRKSSTADATARGWHLIADDTCFYLFVETGDYVSPTQCMSHFFGDIFSYKTNDAYASLIIGRNNENNTNYGGEVFPTLNANAWSTAAGHFMDRSHTGVGGSLQVGKHSDACKQGNNGLPGSSTGTSNAMGQQGMGYSVASGTQVMAMPNGPDGGVYTAPVWIHYSGNIRGYMKGCWAPMQPTPLGHLDTYSGSGNMAGKSFQSFNLLAYTGNVGQVHIETSNTWS